jgi:hypothetical protein
MAQTVDGYLWLGAASGLYRFDVLQFERYRPTSGSPFISTSVGRLLATPDGGLRINYMQGGKSFLKGGRLQIIRHRLVCQAAWSGLLLKIRMERSG